MKVLWMCNVKTSRITTMQGEKSSVNIGGWLEGLSNSLLKTDNIKLVYCYPDYNRSKVESKAEGNFLYYAIPITQNEANVQIGKKSVAVQAFNEILCNEQPDVIHFFGTEFLYTNAFIDCAIELKLQNRIVTSIQGLVSIYALHFNAGLPESVFKRKTLSEVKHKSSLRDCRENFYHRGIYEKEALRKTKYVIGRTSWDEACTHLIAPNAKYFFCNETLRAPFYEGIWKFDRCNKHQIFISQASYPIKGLHKVIEAVGFIKDDFPKIKIVVAGNNIYKTDYIHGNTYGRYLKKLIRKFNLEDNIEFVGSKNAIEMKNMMLESNVFICPSSIENSPNSLGEAMLLGVPCIASDVGGVQDMIKRNEEGFIYPFEETYKLAYYIEKIFIDPKMASEMGIKAREHALNTHSAKKNNDRLMDIYRIIQQEQE